MFTTDTTVSLLEQLSSRGGGTTPWVCQDSVNRKPAHCLLAMRKSSNLTHKPVCNYFAVDRDRIVIAGLRSLNGTAGMSSLIIEWERPLADSRYSWEGQTTSAGNGIPADNRLW